MPDRDEMKYEAEKSGDGAEALRVGVEKLSRAIGRAVPGGWHRLTTCDRDGVETHDVAIGTLSLRALVAVAEPPMTPEEAEAAMDAAEGVPLSPERIDEMVAFATGKGPLRPAAAPSRDDLGRAAYEAWAKIVTIDHSVDLGRFASPWDEVEPDRRDSWCRIGEAAMAQCGAIAAQSVAPPSRDDPATALPLDAAIAEYMRAFGLDVERVEIVENISGRYAKVVIDRHDAALIPFRDPVPAAPPRGAAEGDDAAKRLAAMLDGLPDESLAIVEMVGGRRADFTAASLRALLAAAEARPRVGEATRKVLGVLAGDCGRASEVQTYHFGDGSEDERFTSTDVLAACDECGVPR